MSFREINQEFDSRLCGMRDFSLLFIRESDGSQHFVPFPREGISFKDIDDVLVEMRILDAKYTLRQEDAWAIKRSISKYATNPESLTIYPPSIRPIYLERIYRQKFSIKILLEERLKNLLNRHNIIFIGDLIQFTERELESLKYMGPFNLGAIKSFLREKKLNLGTAIHDWGKYRPVDHGQGIKLYTEGLCL